MRMVIRQWSSGLPPEEKVAPQELSGKDFIDFFQDSWAETLLQLHPEYCLLQKHEMLNKSHEWDRRFELVESCKEARKKGYLNPTGCNKRSIQLLFRYRSVGQ